MEPAEPSAATPPAVGAPQLPAAEIQSALQRNLTPGVLNVAARVLGDVGESAKPKVVQALLPTGTVAIRAIHPDPANRHVVVEAEPIDRVSDDADRSSGAGSLKASGRLPTTGAVVGVAGPAALPIASDEEEWEIGSGGRTSGGGTIGCGGDAMLASVADVMQRAAAKQAAADAAAAAVGPVTRHHPSSAPTPVTAALGGGRAAQQQQQQTHGRIRSEVLESVKHRPLVTGSGVGMTVGSMIFDGWSWVPAAGSQAKEDADAALAEFDAVISSSPPERKRGAHSGAGASSSSSSSSLFAVAPSPAATTGGSAVRGGLLHASPLRDAAAEAAPAPAGQQHARLGSAASNPSDSFWDDDEEGDSQAQGQGLGRHLQPAHQPSTSAARALADAAGATSPRSGTRDTDSVGSRLPVVISDTPLAQGVGTSSSAGSATVAAAASAARHSRLDSLRPAPLMRAGGAVASGGGDAGAADGGNPDVSHRAAGEGAQGCSGDDDDEAEAASPPPSFGSDPRSAGLSTHATGLRMGGAGDAAGTRTNRSAVASSGQVPTSGGSRRSGCGSTAPTTTPGTVELRTTTPATGTAAGTPVVDEAGETPGVVHEALAQQPGDSHAGVNHQAATRSAGPRHYSRRTDGMGSDLARGLLSEPTGNSGFAGHMRSADSPGDGGGPASIASAPDAALSRALGSPLSSDARRTAAAAADATTRAERTVKAATAAAFLIPNDMLQSFLEVEARHRRLRSTWCAAADGSGGGYPLGTALEQPWASVSGPGARADQVAPVGADATSSSDVPPLALGAQQFAAAAGVAASAVTPPVAAVTRASDTGRSDSSSGSPRSAASSRLVDASVSRIFDGIALGPASEPVSEPLSSVESDAALSGGPGGDPHSPLLHARSEIGQSVDTGIAEQTTPVDVAAEPAPATITLAQPLPAEPGNASASQSGALLKVLQAPAPIAAFQRLHEQHQQQVEEERHVDASAYLSRNAAWLQQFSAGPAAGGHQRLVSEAREAAGSRRGSSSSVSGNHGGYPAPAALGSFSVRAASAGRRDRGASGSPRTPVSKSKPAGADWSPSAARGRSPASAAQASTGTRAPRASSLPLAAPSSTGGPTRSPGAAGRYRSPPIKDSSPLTAPTASSRARAAAAAATATSRAEAVAAAAAAARAAAGAHTRPEFSLLLQHLDGTGIGAAASGSGAVTGATTFHRTPGQRQPAAPAAVVARVHKRFAHLTSEPLAPVSAAHLSSKSVARAASRSPSLPNEPAASAQVPSHPAAGKQLQTSAVSPAQRAGSRGAQRTAAADVSSTVSSGVGRGRSPVKAAAGAGVAAQPPPPAANGASPRPSRPGVPARAASIEAAGRSGVRAAGQNRYARGVAPVSPATPGRAASTTSVNRSGSTVARPAATSAASKSGATASSPTTSYAARHAAARDRSLSPAAKVVSQSPSAASRRAAAAAALVVARPPPAAPTRQPGASMSSRARVLRHDAELEALSADADRYAAAAHAAGAVRPGSGSRRPTGAEGTVAAGVNWSPVLSQVVVRAPAAASVQAPVPPALRQPESAPASRSPPALLLPGTRTAGSATVGDRRRVIVPRDTDDEDGARATGPGGLRGPMLPQEVTREVLEARIESLRAALAATTSSGGDRIGVEAPRVSSHHEPHAAGGGYAGASGYAPAGGFGHADPTDAGYHYFEAHPLHMHVPMAAPYRGVGIAPAAALPHVAGTTHAVQYAYSLAPYGSTSFATAAPAPADATPVMVLMPRSAAGHFVRVLPTA